MNSNTLRRPDQVLSELVAASVELVYVRDSALGTALNVPPPSVELAHARESPVATGIFKDMKGLAYRGARKVYRSLQQVEPLQPVLAKLRDQVRHRL